MISNNTSPENERKTKMKKQLLILLALLGLAWASPDAALKTGQKVPNFVLTNQKGQKVQLSQFRGKAVLLTFLFTQCPYPDKCPTIANKLKGTNEILDQAGVLSKVQVLSITLDPNRDTPHMLSAYAQGYDKKRVNWDFLTGSEEAIDEVANHFGVVYYDQNGTIQHNMKTAIIDPQGNLVKVFSGSSWSTQEAATVLKSVVH